MAAITVTNTFSNGTTADATQVNTNFTDIINGLSDGTKDVSISALTCAGAATLNGNMVFGNAAADTITVTGTPTCATAVTVTPTTNQIVLGTTRTATISAETPGAASRVYSIKDPGAAAEFLMRSVQTVTSATTLTTTLTATSPTLTICIGAGTHLVKLPAATGCRVGQIFKIANRSTNAAYGSVIISLSNGSTGLTSISAGDDVQMEVISIGSDASESFCWSNKGEVLSVETSGDTSFTATSADIAGLTIEVPVGVWAPMCTLPYGITFSGVDATVAIYLELCNSANTVLRDTLVGGRMGVSTAKTEYNTVTAHFGNFSVLGVAAATRKLRGRHATITGSPGSVTSGTVTSSTTKGLLVLVRYR